jgi:hypothetical protein
VLAVVAGMAITVVTPATVALAAGASGAASTWAANTAPATILSPAPKTVSGGVRFDSVSCASSTKCVTDGGTAGTQPVTCAGLCDHTLANGLPYLGLFFFSSYGTRSPPLGDLQISLGSDPGTYNITQGTNLGTTDVVATATRTGFSAIACFTPGSPGPNSVCLQNDDNSNFHYLGLIETINFNLKASPATLTGKYQSYYEGTESTGTFAGMAEPWPGGPTTTTTAPTTGKLIISLSGERNSTPDTVAVTMTLRNTGSSDISGLSFTDPTGLENDGVALTNGNIGPTKSGLTLTSGPTPALPTTLPANGPPVVLHYTYSAETSGDAVLVGNATGMDGAGKTVHTKAALTVYVTDPPVSEADYQKLVTSALLAANSVTDQAQNTIATTEGNGLAKVLGVSTASPGQQAAAVSVGLPPQLGVLVGAKSDSPTGVWFNNYFATLSTDVKGGAAYLGDTGKAVANQLLIVATDPDAQDAILGRLYDGLLALPAKTQEALAAGKENLGYLGDAMAASLTPQGQDAWVKPAQSALNSLQTNVTYAVDGFTASKVADVNAYNKDPTAYMTANSTYYANETYGLIKAEILTLLGEGVGVAAKAGYGTLTADAAAAATEVDSTVAASVESTAAPVSGSTLARIEEAKVTTSQFQTLPEGTALPAADAAQLAGMDPGDQVGIQKALKYIKDTYGVDLELGVRTSEPLSLGIDGSPKLSFMKPKAVSYMDMLLGAPKQIAAYAEPGEAASGQVFKGGVTTVFNPVPISDAQLAVIGDTNPEFVTQYKARLSSQQKLWADYENPNSTLRVLVDASSKSEGGVTAIADVPGFRVPPPPAGAQPLIYLQQLDDPAFVEQFGLSTDQAQTLKTQLTSSPGAVQVDYIARQNPGGSISFFDGLNGNRPFVSDLDLQYYQPADGAPWPAGLKGKIQQDFLDQLQKNVSRLPDHGASGTAFDLPAANIGVADAFVMGTANPAFAQAVANNLATRYASQAAIFSSRAAQLESAAALATDPAEVKQLLSLAKFCRQTAATFSKVDAAYLLAKYPPGEKIIVIKLGDVRVGYGASS